eukprot:Pgem_evm1s3295
MDNSFFEQRTSFSPLRTNHYTPDFTIIIALLCTGDMHMGSPTFYHRSETPHNGESNVRGIMNWVRKNQSPGGWFASPSGLQIEMVSGSGVGGLAAQMYMSFFRNKFGVTKFFLDTDVIVFPEPIPGFESDDYGDNSGRNRGHFPFNIFGRHWAFCETLQAYSPELDLYDACMSEKLDFNDILIRTMRMYKDIDVLMIASVDKRKALETYTFMNLMMEKSILQPNYNSDIPDDIDPYRFTTLEFPEAARTIRKDSPLLKTEFLEKQQLVLDAISLEFGSTPSKKFEIPRFQYLVGPETQRSHFYLESDSLCLREDESLGFSIQVIKHTIRAFAFAEVKRPKGCKSCCF